MGASRLCGCDERERKSSTDDMMRCSRSRATVCILLSNSCWVAATRGEAINTLFEERLFGLVGILGKIADTLAAEDIPYELIGGLAVLIHVEEANPEHSTLTRDVGLMVRRADLDRIKLAAGNNGFRFRHTFRFLHTGGGGHVGVRRYGFCQECCPFNLQWRKGSPERSGGYSANCSGAKTHPRQRSLRDSCYGTGSHEAHFVSG